jgi:hypothetical protein
MHMELIHNPLGAAPPFRLIQPFADLHVGEASATISAPAALAQHRQVFIFERS